jgi:hypothetical protein
LASCDQNLWQDYFFAIWTLKEAHAKARGCGLSKILSCSSIVPNLSSAHIDFEFSSIARSDMPLSGWLYQLEEGVSLAAIANSATPLANPSLSLVVPLRSADPLSPISLMGGSWRP